MSAVKRTFVPVPSLEEQDEINFVLATVQRKIELIASKKDILSDLFRTLLHQLMTAQIRVNAIELFGLPEFLYVVVDRTRHGGAI